MIRLYFFYPDLTQNEKGRSHSQVRSPVRTHSGVADVRWDRDLFGHQMSGFGDSGVGSPVNSLEIGLQTGVVKTLSKGGTVFVILAYSSTSVWSL